MLGLCVLVIVLTSCVSTVSTIGESFKAEYYTNISLPCNFTKHGVLYPGLSIPIKRYWILPNSTVLQDTYAGDSKMFFYRPTPYDFDLIITGIDDPDFGVYHCAMVWNNYDYQLGVIKIGLNEDGPLYERQLRQLEKNVIIGGSCAGSVFLILVIACCIYGCIRRNEHKEDKYKHDFNVHSHDTTRQISHDSTRGTSDSTRLTSPYGGYDLHHGRDHDHGHDHINHGRDRGFETRDSTLNKIPADGNVYATVHKHGTHQERGDVVTVQSAHL